jgi:putative flippase GtrA
MHRFLKFALIGSFLFIVDYTFFSIFYIYFSANSARVLSMTISAFISWILNRNFTFEDKKKKKIIQEFYYYYLITVSVAILNYSSSIYLINNFTWIPNFISIGIACIFGAFFNFILLYKLVYI